MCVLEVQEGTKRVGCGKRSSNGSLKQYFKIKNGTLYIGELLNCMHPEISK